MKRECETCIKRKTPYCPTSIDCMATDDMPYYQNRIMLLEENQELKEKIEIYENPEDLTLMFMYCDEKAKDKIRELKKQQKEFISYLENEKDRLARECSQIYEDDLGKTRLVNEDIFNEVNKILSKYKEIIGVSNES